MGEDSGTDSARELGRFALLARQRGEWKALEICVGELVVVHRSIHGNVPGAGGEECPCTACVLRRLVNTLEVERVKLVARVKELEARNIQLVEERR
jgi:hypothetical protein